jgi:hypothetical protein
VTSKVKSCLIDGEIAVCDQKGLAVFDLLRHGSRIKPEAVLFAFDLLELDCEDLRLMPIETRKQGLAKLVRNAGVGLHLSEHLHGDGTEIFEHVCKFGCEGIVSKQVGSRLLNQSSASRVERVAAPPAPPLMAANKHALPLTARFIAGRLFSFGLVSCCHRIADNTRRSEQSILKGTRRQTRRGVVLVNYHLHRTARGAAHERDHA